MTSLTHDGWAALIRTMTSYHEAKVFLEHSTSISHDTLHVIAGVLGLLVFAVLFRRPVSSWRPWAAVLVLIVWNESVDLWVEQWPDFAMQYGESAKDLATTMFLPTLITLTARLRPNVFRAVPRPKRSPRAK